MKDESLLTVTKLAFGSHVHVVSNHFGGTISAFLTLKHDAVSDIMSNDLLGCL